MIKEGEIKRNTRVKREKNEKETIRTMNMMNEIFFSSISKTKTHVFYLRFEIELGF
jgi:hypothetical protein